MSRRTQSAPLLAPRTPHTTPHLSLHHPQQSPIITSVEVGSSSQLLDSLQLNLFKELQKVLIPFSALFSFQPPILIPIPSRRTSRPRTCPRPHLGFTLLFLQYKYLPPDKHPAIIMVNETSKLLGSEARKAFEGSDAEASR